MNNYFLMTVAFVAGCLFGQARLIASIQALGDLLSMIGV